VSADQGGRRRNTKYNLRKKKKREGGEREKGRCGETRIADNSASATKKCGRNTQEEKQGKEEKKNWKPIDKKKKDASQGLGLSGKEKRGEERL